MEANTETGKILWMGLGDLAKKCKAAFPALKEQGYEVSGVDVSDRPIGLDVVRPDRLFLWTSEKEHDELLSMAKRDNFDAVYVANLGHQHMGSALEFYNLARWVIVAKPLDTCLAYLQTISRDQHFGHLLKKLLVHDHYLNKPGVQFLAKIMQRLHSRHGFLESVQLFLVEKDVIEKTQKHRIEVLSCGMLFDLAVHMISILQAIVPRTLVWNTDDGSFERRDRQITVTGCRTARSPSSLLRKSTVIPSREAETFGVVELNVAERIHLDGVAGDQAFPVLVVVAKGVPGEQGMTRDLKTVVMKFRDGAEIALDLDTYQFRGLESEFLKAEGFDNIDRTQRGINLPLVQAAEGHFRFPVDANPFQQYASAFASVQILWAALMAAPPRNDNYGPAPYTCRGLLTSSLRADKRFSDWDLPDSFENLLIGTPPERQIS